MKKKTFATFESSNMSSMFDNIESNNAELSDKGRREYIHISKLKVNPLNEEIFSQDNIEEFADAMKEEGFEGSHTLGVYDLHDGTYEIYSGHRRYLSALKADIEQLPCYIKEEPTEAEKVADLINSNLNTRALSPLEYGKMITKYKEYVLKGESNTRGKLAKHFGISEANVYRYECMMNLIEPLQLLADKHKGVPYTALATASSLNEEQQQYLYSRLEIYFRETKQDDTELTISKSRLSAMIDAIKNGDNEKPKKEESSGKKSSDKKVLSAIKTLEDLTKKKKITFDNPDEIITELKKLDKIVNNLRLKAEDCM